MERRTPWQLARLAGCMDPDSTESPGARWLSMVASIFEDEPDIGEDDLGQEADSSVPTYTGERWAVFVDLGAYQEDVTELGADASDLTQCAAVALYMIAERLLRALWEERQDEDEDEVSTTDDRGVVEVFDIDQYRQSHPDADIASCGNCGRNWDDAVVTTWTPTPSARCPFEYDHSDND